MPAAISFEGFYPPQRYDGESWTLARVQESELKDGPWVTIETIALFPLDADPEHPMARNLTTELSTLEQGWYRIQFVDAEGDTSLPSEPLQNIITAAVGIRPAVHELGALMRARTKNQYGVEIGTFDDTTRPTANQAEQILDTATELVLTSTGDAIPTELYARARAVIKFLAARIVETTYYPEQSDTEQSAQAIYAELYAQALTNFNEALKNNEPTGLRRYTTLPVLGRDGYIWPYRDLPTELLP